MAILGDLLVQGRSRFLQKIYAASLDIGEDTTIAGTLTLSKTNDAVGTSNNSPALVVGGTATTAHLELDSNEIMAKANGTTAADIYVNPDGGVVYIGKSGIKTQVQGNLQVQGTSTFTGASTHSGNLTVSGTTSLAGTSVSSDLNVANNAKVNGILTVEEEIRSPKWIIDNIANLGGEFIIAPTIVCENNTSVNISGPSNNLYTITVTDGSITSNIFGGIAWSTGSVVKVSGTINDTVLVSINGTMTRALNQTTGTIQFTVNSSNITLTAGTYTGTKVKNLHIMMYKVGNVAPVGIFMTSYGQSHYPYIDIYSGTTSGSFYSPTTRLGYLNGLTDENGNALKINNISPTGWGLYTSNGYFSGTIVSTSGKIGGFNLDTTKIYSGTNSISSTTVGVYLGTDGIRNYNSASQSVTIKNGIITAIGADVSGKITATSGEIGGFAIDSSSIHTKNVAVISNADNSISLSSTDFTRTINNTSRAGLRFAIGDKFGITGDGVLYTNGANITNINASNISTGTVSVGVLPESVKNENVSFDNRVNDSIQFLYRKTGDTEGVQAGQATIKSIKGNTIVWNQLAPSPFGESNTLNGITFAKSGDGMTIKGTATNIVYKPIKNNVKTVAGHTYFVRITGTGLTNVRVYNDGGGVSVNAANGSGIGVANAAKLWYLRIDNGTEIDGFAIVSIFDLTQMFGAGNEPETVAEFEALYPELYYPYDAGSLLPVAMTGIATDGFNQWDEEWELGTLVVTTGAKSSSNSNIRTKNFNPCFPNTNYFFCMDKTYQSGASAIIFYDANAVYISYEQFLNSKVITTPANARYFMFALTGQYGTTYKNDICINISDPARNGEYEPYWSAQRTIDIATYFPMGLKKAGIVYDELTGTERITRVGEVDLGSLTWIVTATGSTGQYRMVSNGLRTLVQKPASNAVLANITCQKYDAHTSTEVYQLNAGICVDAAGDIVVYDPNYATQDSAAAFKTAMSGIMLYYELATPIITSIDLSLNLSYRMDNLGTERIIIPEEKMSSPPTLDITYGVNLYENAGNIAANLSNTETLITNTNNLIINTRTWYATCSTAAATTAKEATTTDSGFVLKEGVVVDVKFTNTNTGAVGSLTLNVNDTGAKSIKTMYNNSLANITNAGQLYANSIIHFVYNGTYWIAETNYNSDNDSNAMYVRYYNTILAGEALQASSIIGGRADGKFYQIKENSSFDLAHPLLWTTGAIPSGGTNFANIYMQCYDVNLGTYYTSFTNTTKNCLVYLVGTVSGNTFTTYGANSASYLTVTPPTTADGRFYIPIGRLGNSSNGKNYFNFQVSTPVALYAYIDGKFRQVTPTDIVATQRIYYRSNSNTKPNGAGLPTTWVTENGNKFNTNATTAAGWSKKVSPMTSDGVTGSGKYIYLWTCEQRKRLDGTIDYTEILLDDSTTIIDGGNIITGSIVANKIQAGSITADRLNTTSINSSGILTLNAFASTTQSDILNSNVEIGGRNLLRNTNWNLETIEKFKTATSTTNVLGNAIGEWHRETQATLGFNESGLMTITVPNSGSRFGIYQDVSLSPGHYILSIDTGSFFKSHIDSVQWPTKNKIEGSDSRNSVEIDVTEEAVYRVYIASNNGTVMYGNYMKLEKGNKATDWTPAPEDVDASLSLKANKDTLTTEINASADTVKINADRVNIEGAAIFSSGRLSQTSLNNAYDAKGAATTAKTEAINASYANMGFKYKKDIVVYGDSDKYYPIYLNNNMSDYSQSAPHEVVVTRGYSEQAPNEWNPSSNAHHGALNLRLRWNYGGWGGATYVCQIYDFSEMYSTMLGDVLVGNKSGMNSTIYLRGGGTTGAIYHIYSEVAIDSTRYDATFPYIGTNTGDTYMTSGSYTWTVDNPLTTPNRSHILSLAAVVEEQYIYRSVSSGVTSVDKIETWVTTNTEVQNSWTTKRPTYNSSYPVLFIAKQRRMAFGLVTCTTPVKDDTTTVIDGGHITTGTIDTNRLNADTIKSNIVQTTELNADKITSGDISAARIKANVISAINSLTAGQIDADRINAANLHVNAANIDGSLTIGDVNGLQSALNGKQATGDYATKTQAQGYATTAESNAKTFATDTVNNLSIGGRNLLQRSFITTYSTGTSAGVLNTDEYISSGTVIYSRGTNQNEGFYISRYSEMDGSTNYVISFKAKVVSGSITQIYIYATAPTNITATADTSVYMNGSRIGTFNSPISVSMTTGTYYDFCLEFATPSNISSGSYVGEIIQWNKTVSTAFEVEMTNLKWEKGTKATDWSPAPEDIDADINIASQTATNYIYADSNGIKISQSNPSSATTNYMQITSNGIKTIYNSTYFTNLTSTGLKIHAGNANNPVASYGSSTIFYEPGTTTVAAEVDSNGINVKVGTFGNATNKITVGTGTSGHSAIRYGMTTLADTTNTGFYIGTDGIALGKGVFKVTAAGALVSTSATITGTINATAGYFGSSSSNGWQIDSNAIKHGTLGSSGGYILNASGNSSATINGGARTNLALAIGSKFGVGNDGTLYANGANITNINASNINAGTLNIGYLPDTVKNENISIGGKNLLRNSEVPLPSNTPYNNSNVTKYNLQINGIDYYYCSGTKYWRIDFPTLISGETYNLWFDIARSSTSQNIYVKIGDSEQNVGTAPINSWIRLGLSFVASSTTTYAEIRAAYNSTSTNSDYIAALKCIKLEKGNKATDWTPAPEDQTAYVNDSIANIVVSSTNLIRNGDFSNGTQYWDGTGGTRTVETDSTFGYCLKFVQSAAGSSDYRVFPRTGTTNFSLTNGETYSISFYAKANAVNTINCTRGYQATQRFVNAMAITTTWQRYTATFTANGSSAIDFSLGSAGTLYLTQVMLVHGDKPQDWSPDPRDVDSSISSAAKRTDVSVSVTAIDYSLGTATLQATLYIDGTATTSNVTYKWLKDGSVISGQTTRTLNVTAAMGLSHVYSCTVTYS